MAGSRKGFVQPGAFHFLGFEVDYGSCFNANYRNCKSRIGGDTERFETYQSVDSYPNTPYVDGEIGKSLSM